MSEDNWYYDSAAQVFKRERRPRIDKTKVASTAIFAVTLAVGVLGVAALLGATLVITTELSWILLVGDLAAADLWLIWRACGTGIVGIGALGAVRCSPAWSSQSQLSSREKQESFDLRDEERWSMQDALRRALPGRKDTIAILNDDANGDIVDNLINAVLQVRDLPTALSDELRDRLRDKYISEALKPLEDRAQTVEEAWREQLPPSIEEE